LKTASLASRWGYLVAHTQTITDHRIRLSDVTRGDAEPGDLLGRDRQHRVNASGFASAFFAIQHERGVATLFIVSLVAFTVSLVDFAWEVRIALSEFAHHA
jgi:hypothetical protein